MVIVAAEGFGLLKIDGHRYEYSYYDGYKKYQNLPEPCGHPCLSISSEVNSVHNYKVLFLGSYYSSKVRMKC